VIYSAGDCSRAKTVVDIHNRDPRRAAVQHAQERGESAEARSITHAGRHGDDGYFHEPSDDTWQRALHAGDDDDGSRSSQASLLAEQSVDAGHADVKQAIHWVTHHLRRDTGFLRNGQIRSTRGSNQNRAPARLNIPLAEGDCAGERLKTGGRHNLPNGRESVLAGAGYEEGMASSSDFPGDSRDLLRGLAEPEHDFREPLAQLALVIDPRKPQVLERRGAQQLGNSFDRSLSRHVARFDLVQQLLEIRQSHGSGIICRHFAAGNAH
jgi:hypothetical protein